jgi:hypothetical protein
MVKVKQVRLGTNLDGLVCAIVTRNRVDATFRDQGRCPKSCIGITMGHHPEH